MNDVSEIRAAFVESAEAARRLVTRTEVAERWKDPSALPMMTVQGLCGHVLRALEGPLRYCAAPPPTDDPVPPVDYYMRVLPSTDLDHPVNKDVRIRAEETGAGSHEDVARRFTTRVEEVISLIHAEAPDRVVRVLGGVPLTLDDYLVTRIVELVVHVDDLAVSVGVSPPPPPDRCARIAIDFMVRLAVRRHGDLAVIRALSRRERDDVQALRVF